MHFVISLQMIWPIMYMKYKFISPRKVLLVLMITKKKLEFLGAKDSQCDFTGRKEEKEKNYPGQLLLLLPGLKTLPKFFESNDLQLSP